MKKITSAAKAPKSKKSRAKPTKSVRKTASNPVKAAVKTRSKPKAVVAAPVAGLSLAVTGYVAPIPVAPVANKNPELAAPRDVGRLLRYGEMFGSNKIEVRWLPNSLPFPSGSVSLGDPGVKKSTRVLDRAVPTSAFRCMMSIAIGGPKKIEKLAALVLHCGRPPIARWTVAYWKGQKPPKSVDQIPQFSVSSGWISVHDANSTFAPTDTASLTEIPNPTSFVECKSAAAVLFAFAVEPGQYTAYWALDAQDKPVCLVLDFDVFTDKEWRSKSPAAI
jgi:hypothetical protein